MPPQGGIFHCALFDFSGTLDTVYTRHFLKEPAAFLPILLSRCLWFIKRSFQPARYANGD